MMVPCIVSFVMFYDGTMYYKITIFYDCTMHYKLSDVL